MTLIQFQVRGQLYPFTVAFSWLCNFGFSKAFPYLEIFIGLYGIFWGYAGITFIGGVFVFLGIPETRNKTAEEVAAFYNKVSDSKAEIV